MRRAWAVAWIMVASAGCAKKSRPGETCSSTGDCEGDARCVASRCVDPGAEAAREKLAVISTALDLYKVDTGDYPSQSEGLDQLARRTAGQEPYIKDPALLKDPWNQPFVYYNPSLRGGMGVDVLSKGPDKREGTIDDIVVR